MVNSFRFAIASVASSAVLAAAATAPAYTATASDTTPTVSGGAGNCTVGSPVTASFADFSIQGVTNDGSNEDYLAVYILDENDTILSSDGRAAPVGGDFDAFSTDISTQSNQYRLIVEDVAGAPGPPGNPYAVNANTLIDFSFTPADFNADCAPPDTTPPEVVSTSLVATSTTNTFRQFKFEMDEAPLNVDASDFSYVSSGSAAATGMSVGVSGTTITVIASGVSGSGGLAVRLNANSDITDAAGNGNGTNGFVATATTDEHVVTVDAPPSVQSQAAASQTGATRRFTFTFDQSVVNASVDDFEVTPLTGNVSGSPTSLFLSNSDRAVNVTVTLAGAGTYRVDFKSNTDVVDLDGNGNGTNGFSPAYTSGATYSVDLEPPAVPSTPEMASASDSGISDSDNITNQTEITFTGTGEVGSTVFLRSDNPNVSNLGSAVVSGAGTWSITSPVFTAIAAQNIFAFATDANNNTSANSASLPIVIDVSAPVTGTLVLSSASDTGDSDSDEITNDNTPTLTGSTDANATITVRLSGGAVVATGTADGSGAFSVTTSALSDGTVALFLHATDQAGNATPSNLAALSIQLDTVAPPTPAAPAFGAGADIGASPSDGLTSNATPLLTGSVGEAFGYARITSSLDGEVANGQGNGSAAFSLTTSPLREGTHTFTVQTRDEAGNLSAESPASAPLTIDTTPPAGYTITIDQDPVTAANAGVASLTYSGLEVGSEFAISFNFNGGSSPTPTTGTVAQANGQLPNIDLSPLPDGPIGVSLILTDVAGNAGAAATDSATKDATAPRIASITRQTPSTSPTDADSVTWRVTFTEDVQNVGAADFAVAGTTGTVSGVNGIDAATYDVTVSGGNMSGLTAEITLSLAGGQDIEDLASNALINPNPTVSNQNTFDIDNTEPQVASISFHDPTDQFTTAEVLTWEIVFDEFVRNISANDFTITGTTATISGFAQQGDATTYRVTISGGNLATETVFPTIAFAGDQDITDWADNSLTNTSSQGTNETFYNVDNSPPIVTDIFASNNATVGSTLVTWSVSINEDPDNLTIDDFTLDTSAGVTAADLQIATDTGTSVTVTANLTGSGIAQLKFNAGTDIVDGFGNGNGTNGFAPAYDDDSFSVATVDTVPPRLQSVSRFNGAAEDTNADTLVWLVTFDTPVRNVDAADFAVTGTTAGLAVQIYEDADQPEDAGISAPAAAPLSPAYRVTTTGGDLADLDGLVTLGLTGSPSIVDANGNALIDTGATGSVETYTVDNAAPLITGLQRNDPEQTNRDSVSWRIAFDSEMQNLTADDFAVSGTTATVSLTAINALEHTVTLSGGDLAGLNGTVTLSIDPGHNLTDAAGNALTNLTPVLDPNEPSYAIDNTGPQLLSLTRSAPAASPTSADSLTWRLDFNELVVNVNAADFSVLGTTATILLDQPEDNIIEVTLSGGDLATLDGTVTLALNAGNDITDGAGNALTNLTGLSEHTPGFVVDNTAPSISTVTRASPNSENTNADTLIWRVSFSEAVGNVDAGDFSVAGTTASVTAVNAFSGDDQPERAGDAPEPLATASTYTVTVSGGDLDSLDGTVTLTPLTTGGITDAAGNVLTNAVPTSVNRNSYNLDNSAPALLSIARQTPFGERTNADSLTFIVMFSEEVKNADAADFEVNGTTTATVTGVVATDAGFDQPEIVGLASSPSSSAYEVTVSGGDLAGFTGIVGLDLAAAPTISDAAGNAVSSGEPGTDETYDVRNIAPALASIERLTPAGATTNADSLTWRLTFSQIDSSFSLPGNAFTVTGTDASVSNVSRFSIGFDVTVSGGSPGNGLENLNGDVTLGLADTDFADDYGNVMDRTIPAGAELTYALDNAAPTVAVTGPGGSVSGAFTATFTFSEAVSDFELVDISVGNGSATDLQTSDNVVFAATVTPSGDGNVTVDIAADAAADAAGNGNTAATRFSVTNDQTAPRIASIGRQTPTAEQTDADSLTWRVRFSEFVQNVDAGDFQIAGTTATLSVAAVATAGDVAAGDTPQPSSTNTFDVTASGGDLANLNGAVILSALTTGGITDNAGNALANAAPTGTNDNSYSVINDAEAPTVLSIVRRTPSSELTNADSLTWQVTFSEAVENVDAADFAPSGTTASVTGVSAVAAMLPPSLAGAGQNGGIVPFAVSSQAFEVTVSGGALAGLNGPVSLGLAGAQNIADTAGNDLTNTAPTGANQSYTLDNIVPTVNIASSAVTPVAGAFPITITFSEDVTGFDVSDLDLGNGNASNFASTDARTYTATVTPGSGATVTIDIPANAASDGAGNGNTAATQFSIGYDNVRTLSVALTGSGEGTISSSPAGLDCTDDCNADFIVATEVIVSAIAADGSTFLEWTDGPCVGTRNENCIVPMTTDRSVAARFHLDEPPAGRIVAATLPAARSGYVGGPVLTALMSVVSRNETPAQGCYVSAPFDAPISLTTQRLDAEGNPVGTVNPNFDIEAGGTVSLVLGMTPTAETDGYDLFPIILCENAVLDPIEGVNSVFLAIDSAPVPDVLSISATQSADGVIRIGNSGGAGAMAASAVNIGAGDGSAGANEITLTVTVDTGSASLPLSLEMCRINADAQCISPRGSGVTTVMTRNDPYFFAVFVRDTSEGAGIPLDPANARVFLRFTDASGTIRSVTSVAVTAPAAADAPVIASAMPEGRWSVLMRQEEGVWPSLTRAALHVSSDGLAIADDGVSPRLIHLEGSRIAADEPQNGQVRRFTRDGTDGHWTVDGRVLSGGAWIDNAGEFYGIRDARSGAQEAWDEFAGAFGDGIRISPAGEIRGMVAGCSVYGQSTGSASSLVMLTLSGCASSGGYAGVIDLPANDGDVPVLVIAGERSGWRLAAN